MPQAGPAIFWGHLDSLDALRVMLSHKTASLIG